MRWGESQNQACKGPGTPRYGHWTCSSWHMGAAERAQGQHRKGLEWKKVDIWTPACYDVLATTMSKGSGFQNKDDNCDTI